jgi:transcriptional regulator with XRE-family HTH domain
MTKIVDIKEKISHRGVAADEDGQPPGTREYHRIPWSGNLDEAELSKPGGLLLAALIRAANERRLQLNDMAKELGVTYGYINQLRNGIRQVNQVSDDFALACALFLGVPRLSVLMLAGRITPEDAFEHRELMAAEISRAMAYICDDQKWGELITPELRKVDTYSQYAIVRLYQEATGKVLMNTHISLETLAKEVQSLKAIQASRTKAVDAHSARKQRSE